MLVFFIIIGIIVTTMLISWFVNQVLFSKELDNLQPYGQMVDIDGRKMHVYSMGNGRKTIVLLSGYGVPLPCADFGPLIRTLSKKYTVVCVEYFGVGFSDQTDTPRTNENYTEELRTALLSAGFDAPYILMPHSASGIYSEYYATKYPDEVTAIVMLDTTSSAKTEPTVPNFTYSLAKIQQAIDFNRLFNPLIVKSTLLITESNGYTKKEIVDYIKFMNHLINDTTIDQLARLNDNIREVMGMEFPVSVPVLKLVASSTVKQVGEQYQIDHLQRLGGSSQQTVIVGTHFIYHTAAAQIADVADAFLESRVR